MFGLELSAPVLALIGTIIATLGVKIAERWLTKRDRASTDASQIRSELKEQVASYKEDILRLEDEVDEWRNKYYTTLEELVAKRIELQQALDEVRRLAANTEQMAEKAKKIVDDTKLN